MQEEIVAIPPSSIASGSNGSIPQIPQSPHAPASSLPDQPSSPVLDTQRDVQASQRSQSLVRHWLVFDGPLQGDWLAPVDCVSYPLFI